MNTITAAVVASNGDSATAVAFSPQDLENAPVAQAFRDNNIALKFFSDTSEDRFARPTTHCVELTHRDPIPIGVTEHEKGTVRYRFRDQHQPRSWRQMHAGMTYELLDRYDATWDVEGYARTPFSPTPYNRPNQIRPPSNFAQSNSYALPYTPPEGSY